ncbi:MAG: Gfo/Idh/MocA family oxidoreductase [Gammaproteobacteria bacterium]|nr:Gfo/Idh/MocA family oxidoreductase [Gammaproteobacteria bacterium]
MKIAIIGCGLIGQKRAQVLSKMISQKDNHFTLAATVDSVQSKAIALAQQFSHCEAFTNWRDVIDDPTIQIVMISTLHATLAEIAEAAVRAGKHVFIEKPAARHVEELTSLMEAAKKSRSIVRVGFNHRYHRAFIKARELVDANELGELMFVRARYGHGGRVGYDKEWRADPALSGGGELIDQGVHLIDLARWFLGDFTEIQGHAHTYYWDMPVDDNGFLLLKTAKKQTAFLHASCTEWKNTFSFEIYGKHGKIDINGLGGSYGTERITFYKMLPEMGPPETFMWEYPMADNSWEVELTEFLSDIQHNRPSQPGLADAHAALSVVGKIYDSSSL